MTREGFVLKRSEEGTQSGRNDNCAKDRTGWVILTLNILWTEEMEESWNLMPPKDIIIILPSESVIPYTICSNCNKIRLAVETAWSPMVSLGTVALCHWSFLLLHQSSEVNSVCTFKKHVGECWI
jgi:hypothetical protein